MPSQQAAVAVAIAVVLDGDRVLIGQRGDDVPLAGLWEFPGGKIEQGETPAAAAIRECREETGLDVDVVAPLPHVTHQYEHARVQLSFFSCALRQSASMPREPYRWVKLSELGNYSFPPANAPILAYLQQKTADFA